MTTLDDLKKIKKIDRHNLAKNIAEFPEQCAKALAEMETIKLPANFSQAEKIVICGMGGSAIGGDLAKAMLPEKEKMPIIVIRGYDLPAWVDDKTLVICASYSGETEETIGCFEQALEKKAKIFAIAGGGRLADLARKNNVPLYQFNYQSQPRAALGYLLVPILAVLEKLKIISPEDADIKQTLAFLQEFNQNLIPEKPTQNNLAKQLAFAVFDRLPVAVGAGILTAVARRWKTQFNENAKTFAYFEELPEFSHNAAEGISSPQRIKDDAIFLLLESSLDHPRVQKRFQILKKLLEKERIEFQEIYAMGTDVWTQKLSLVILGDWVSFYLAALNETDPAAIENIAWTKKQL